MWVDEPDINIADELKKDWPQIQADVEAGRVLYIIGREPHKEGCWAMLQEFAQIVNQLVKIRKPAHLRLLMTYDKELPGTGEAAA